MSYIFVKISATNWKIKPLNLSFGKQHNRVFDSTASFVDFTADESLHGLPGQVHCFFFWGAPSTLLLVYKPNIGEIKSLLWFLSRQLQLCLLQLKKWKESKGPKTHSRTSDKTNIFLPISLSTTRPVTSCLREATRGYPLNYFLLNQYYWGEPVNIHI